MDITTKAMNTRKERIIAAEKKDTLSQIVQTIKETGDSEEIKEIHKNERTIHLVQDQDHRKSSKDINQAGNRLKDQDEPKIHEKRYEKSSPRIFKIKNQKTTSNSSNKSKNRVFD